MVIISYTKTSYSMPIGRIGEWPAGVASFALARVGRPVTFLLVLIIVAL